ncbi:hypothetical protein GFM29_03160 [Rhizobium leguminosarum bv. viciae]|nr:hypothetical protein [Rhizobium leguminosarum bv. viciae]
MTNHIYIICSGSVWYSAEIWGSVDTVHNIGTLCGCKITTCCFERVGCVSRLSSHDGRRIAGTNELVQLSNNAGRSSLIVRFFDVLGYFSERLAG